MPNYLNDIIGEEERKKDKSIVGRIKKSLGYKDYKEELPHSKENTDKPWESLEKSTTSKPQKKTPPLPKNDSDERIKELPMTEAERLAEQRRKIRDRVGGWSKK